jgi:hypothetical protein
MRKLTLRLQAQLDVHKPLAGTRTSGLALGRDLSKNSIRWRIVSESVHFNSPRFIPQSDVGCSVDSLTQFISL